MQLLWQIPVEKRNKRGDARFQQVVDKLRIVVDPGLIDGIVATALGDDSRPRNGEAVRFGSKGFQKCNIFGRAVVRVAGSNTG